MDTTKGENFRDNQSSYVIYHKPIFLIPLYGGIWTLCMDVTHKEIRLLRERARYRHGLCSSYLNISIERSRREEMRGDWSHNDAQASIQPHMRMQNLSISCSLVCLIILGSAALVGAFGICQKQISAILITGIMYLLAALFALFTLTIIHYKRQHGRPIVESDFDDNMVDGIVTLPGAMRHAHRLLSARIIAFSWSLQLGWGGVLLCTLTSGLWILLSKVLRYNPISAFAI
ncbi:uncharacterized protein LOC129607828 isoform X2 [Condylostylus longicornis]|uniref:uncharacterized protein LOC129607828 isoform X2 n=1 Tax=Condylostylus longicornis TaxID=2530218 RepID=UPI00244E039B|nr:uncharacterized protein LOC129607828 isoform X2 [Condylostylus longicornis]